MTAKKTDITNLNLNVKALSLSLGILLASFALILSTWCRFTGFGEAFWLVFTSLHPSVYQVDMIEPVIWKHVVGILIDVLYTFIDFFIIGSLLAIFYNFFNKK